MLNFFLSKAVKAVAGGVAGALGSVGTTALALPNLAPADSELTLVGYIVVGALNGAIGFATVYFAPANR